MTTMTTMAMMTTDLAPFNFDLLLRLKPGGIPTALQGVGYKDC